MTDVTMTTKNKERGIILTADEVRGLRDGSLRELRRPVHHHRSWYVGADDDGDPWPFLEAPARYLEPAPIMMACPFGQPGDRLWVREKHCLAHPDYHSEDEGRRLGRPMRNGRWFHYAATDDVDIGDGPSPWRSAAVMPRWASRWTLENAAVRVEWNATAERWDWIVGVKQVEP